MKTTLFLVVLLVAFAGCATSKKGQAPREPATQISDTELEKPSKAKKAKTFVAPRANL